MPPSSDPNEGVPPAAMLLNPKAYSKQLALGNSSSSSTSYPASMELAAPGETTNSSHPVPSKSSSSTDEASQSGDENSAYSSHEGRRRAPNSPASGSRTPQQNVSGKPNDGMTPLGTAFDPRQLLNPKSYPSKPSRSSNTMPAGNGDSASEDLQKKRELEDNRGAGQGSLIENLYGVEARVSPPPKKQKTDSESTTPSASNFSISGNTGLGDYMKEGETTVKKDITAQRSVIDLTLGWFTLIIELNSLQFFASFPNILS